MNALLGRSVCSCMCECARARVCTCKYRSCVVDYYEQIHGAGVYRDSVLPLSSEVMYVM